MESPLSPRDSSTAIDVHSESDQSERSNAEQQAPKIRCKPILLHLNAKNEGSRIPAHLMDIELRYTHKMQTTTKNLVATALKTFMPLWAEGPSFCEVYGPKDVTNVFIDLDGKGCVLPSDAERDSFIEKAKKILAALMDAPGEEIDVCIRPSDVPYSCEWNAALNKEVPLYKLSIRMFCSTRYGVTGTQIFDLARKFQDALKVHKEEFAQVMQSFVEKEGFVDLTIYGAKERKLCLGTKGWCFAYQHPTRMLKKDVQIGEKTFKAGTNTPISMDDTRQMLVHGTPAPPHHYLIQVVDRQRAKELPPCPVTEDTASTIRNSSAIVANEHVQTAIDDAPDLPQITQEIKATFPDRFPDDPDVPFILKEVTSPYKGTRNFRLYSWCPWIKRAHKSSGNEFNSVLFSVSSLNITMTCSKCTKSKTGKNNGTEEPIKRPRIRKRISKRKSTTTTKIIKKKANTATPEDSSDDLEPPQIENHATDASTDEEEEESTDEEEDEDSEDEEPDVKRKSRDNGKSDYDKKEAARDVEKYRPLNYHGGLEACKSIIERHTGLKVKSEQMSSKEECVFINLGFCQNNSPECTKSEKDANFGTWIRMTRTEIQMACYGKKVGLGCSNSAEVYSLLTSEEEKARKLLDIVLLQKYPTADHDVAEIMHTLQPLMVERCNGYFLICGENNVWKLTPKVSESDLHIRIKKEVFSYLSEYKDRYLGWAPNKHSRKVIRDVKIPHMEKFIKTKYNCGQVAEVLVHMVPSDSRLAHKVLQTSKDFLAFSDGQKINLRTGEVSAIKPEDYINRTTGYPMPKKSDPNIRERIMAYFKTSLREEQVPYLLEESALSLHGSNIKERVLVVKGKEGGGKTVYGILFVKALGGYAESLGLHVITKEAGNQDSTNSQMFDLFAARLVQITEPGKNDVLIASKIKNLTSEESKSRPLFGSNLTFENIALILIGTNYAPRYSCMEGIPRRLRVVEFPYQFKDEQKDVDEANRNRSEDEPEIRLANLGWKDDVKKPEYIAEFMLMLMETYDRKFSDRANNPNKSIDEPTSVHNYTLETLKESCNEGVVEFVQTHIRFEGQENTNFVLKADLHLAYQERFRKSNKRIPLGQKAFYDELLRLKTIKEKKILNRASFTGMGQGIVLKALPAQSNIARYGNY